MLTFCITNWKLVLIGVLLLAIASLAAAYEWQRASLVKSQAAVTTLTADVAARDAQIAAQTKNLADIKVQMAKIQATEKIVYQIREVIRNVPTVSFSGDCAKPQEEQHLEAESIERAAGLIVLFFNTGMCPAGLCPGGSGQVLPAAGTTDSVGPQKSN